MKQTTIRLGSFGWRVLAQFIHNKGLLISGGVAYNALLSIIPFCAVLAIVIGGLLDVDEDRLIEVVNKPIRLIAPGETQQKILENDVRMFWRNRHVFGIVGSLVVLFLCSLAFRMLEDAMAIIFSHAPEKKKRRFWVSAVIPFAYMLVVGIGLFLVTALSTTSRPEVMGLQGWVLWVLGLISQLLMFTSIYMVMPTARVQFSRAVAGGLTALILWRITYLVLEFWFEKLSLVTTIYQNMASVIVVLLALEVATVIILLGAQVIAELEHSADAGLPWYEPAPSST